MFHITAMDHIVLRVRDVEASLRFYQGVLGLPGDRVEQWRAGEARFPSVRVSPTTIIDLLGDDAAGSGAIGNLDHFSLLLDVDDAEVVRQELLAAGVAVETDTRDLSGAQGRGNGFYLRDPDGNKIELRAYRRSTSD